MKIEMNLGSFITTIAIAYLAGQAVGCVKTALINIAYDDIHKS